MNHTKLIKKIAALIDSKEYESARDLILQKGEPEKSPLMASTLGSIHLSLGRTGEARQWFQKSIRLGSNQPEDWGYLALTMATLGEPEADVRAAITSAAQKFPNDPVLLKILADAESNLSNPSSQTDLEYRRLMETGLQMMESRAFSEALETLNKALAVKQTGECYFVIGQLLAQMELFDFALAHHVEALKFDPDNETYLLQAGNACYQTQKWDDAAGFYGRIWQLNNGSFKAALNLGNIEKKRGKIEQAIHWYELATRLEPENFLMLHNLGGAYDSAGYFDEAIATLARAVELNPDNLHTLSILIYTKAKAFDWDGIQSLQSRLVDGINALERGSANLRPSELPPGFCLFSFCDDMAVYAKTSSVASETVTPAYSTPFAYPDIGQERRLRVCYLSNEFCSHATGYLFKDLVGCHNRDLFEVFGLDYGDPSESDDWHAAIKAQFDHFENIRNLTDEAAAKRINELQIDILIDLKGYTRNSRIGILAHRPAPVQLHYLGYPAPIDAGWLDYYISDPTLTPPRVFDSQTSTRFLNMSGCYQCNPADRVQLAREDKETALGVPADRFVFCCFNSSWKINQDTVRVWGEILRACPDSSLWVLTPPGASAKARFEGHLEALGVTADRLMFAEFAPIHEHLIRLTAADLMLDCFPCSGHTTASDAAAAGVPVLTRMGNSIISRVAGSINVELGLHELNTDSDHEYVAKAIEIYESPDYLTQLKAKLSPEHLRDASMFNPKKHTRNLEDVLLEAIKKPRV